MKLSHYSGNCHLNKVLKTFSRQSVSSIVLLLATILIISSLASAEVRKEYYPSGKSKSEVNVINGKEEGFGKMYYESVQSWMEKNFKNGKTKGIAKHYYKLDS